MLAGHGVNGLSMGGTAMRGKEPADPRGYPELLADLKGRIQTARVKAALAVNAELILLYWGIGKDILRRQTRAGWGAKVMQQLSGDLRSAFPDMKGLSVRNLINMRDLARAWPSLPIVQQLVAQLPWGHNTRLIQKVKGRAEREWYIRACVENGWSRNVFEMQIETDLYGRRGAGQSNFERTLPTARSELVQGLLKDPYYFEFLGIAGGAREREIELGLVSNIQRFLIELGQGFAFVGNQVQLQVGGEDFYLDLLFYHLQLRCYIVIELKAGSFKPEYAGKLNFYLAAVDGILRHAEDAPSIGLILCRGKNRVVAEYSLSKLAAPLGISEYCLTGVLPEPLAQVLPSVEELETELGRNQARGGEAND